jgi:hypothetical protein
MSYNSSVPNCSRAPDTTLDVRPITPAIGAEIHGVVYGFAVICRPRR